MNINNILKTEKGHLNIVQVGANDGKYGDMLYDFVMKNKDRTSILLIEPQEEPYEQLKENYKDHPDATFVNCAVGDQKTVTLYRAKKEHWRKRGNWPVYREATGVASYDKKVALSPYKNNKKIQLESIEYTCKSLRDILTEYNFTFDIDLLVVDTEGMDGIIVSQAALSGLCPRRIIFEHGHLDFIDKGFTCLDLLSKSYRLFEYDKNTLAERIM